MHPHIDNIEEKDLIALLESFGSAFSLEDIATAYCEANRNVDLAAEILCSSNSNDLKGASDPMTLSSAPQSKIAEPSKVSSAAELFPKPSNGKKNLGAAVKSKPQPASVGTVSGVVGRGYIQPKTLNAPYNKEVKKKPLKLDAKELPESEIWGDRNNSVSAAAAKDTVSDDVVNFLFKMLGDGFELDKNKIRDVLGLCGYDVKQTMEELLDISTSTLEKSDDVHGLTGDNTRTQSRDQISEASHKSSEEASNPTDSSKRDRDRVGLQKEILHTLFTYPQKSEEKPKVIRRPVRATPVIRPVVTMPEDTPTVEQSTAVGSQIVKEGSDDDDENSYKVLRKAVNEHWITMKEYYSAAVDAFVKGDYARANRLREQGHFYSKKAREADEKSSQRILQTKNDEEDEIPIDLSEHEPKEALRLLKLHLTSLCGIHTIKYLRVIVGTGDEDRKGARKRLIVRQLEKNSIQWTEEDNGRILRLLVDVIDPKSLSFAQKN